LATCNGLEVVRAAKAAAVHGMFHFMVNASEKEEA
jgi:hypothetical protein